MSQLRHALADYLSLRRSLRYSCNSASTAYSINC
jgi:hypothetical protein